MADRKSFVLYKSWGAIFSTLDDEKAGILIKSIYEYQNGGEPDIKDVSLQAIFTLFQEKFDEDTEKYNLVCQKNRENGSKGGKQKVANGKRSVAVGSDCKRNVADTDTDADNDNNKDIYISLLLEDGSSYEVTKEELEENKKIYPNVDVEQSYRSMAGWLLSNPSKRKTRKGIKRFINGWLSREKEEKKDHKNKQYDFKKLEEWVKAQ